MPQHHLVIPDTVETIFKLGNGAGRTFKIVIHQIAPAGQSVTSALAEQVFASVKPLWTAQMAPNCPAQVTFLGVDMRDLRDQGFPLVSSTGTIANGTGTGEVLPLSIACCFTLRTDRAGKKYRGRMYWGGFSETANSVSGQIIAAAKTQFDAFATGFRAAVNVSGLQLAVAHRPTAYDEITGMPISPGLGFSTPVTSVVCRDVNWDSQRRRIQ